MDGQKRLGHKTDRSENSNIYEHFLLAWIRNDQLKQKVDFLNLYISPDLSVPTSNELKKTF